MQLTMINQLELVNAPELICQMRFNKETAKEIELITITALRESQQPKIRCPCLLLPGMRGVESTMMLLLSLLVVGCGVSFFVAGERGDACHVWR